MCNLLITQWRRYSHLYIRKLRLGRVEYFVQGPRAGKELALHLAPTVPAPPSPVST